ncbi:unnamed protein product [Mytilus coruscus]|uniref:Uncharacterized protein n=1 Tax=Mytilus coruscus TaxID=42192 RepID=A0A6J8CCS7_MYTCO|nr:unnamed protein product [Mytilus coruscus]
MSLDIVKHHTNGIYYEVYMVKRLANSINCNGDLEVTCQLIKNYSIAIENKLLCKSEALTDDSGEEIELLVGSLSVLLNVVIMVIAFRLLKEEFKRRESKQKDDTNKDVESSYSSTPSSTDASKHDSSPSKPSSCRNEQCEPFLSPEKDLSFNVKCEEQEKYTRQ